MLRFSTRSLFEGNLQQGQGKVAKFKPDDCIHYARHPQGCRPLSRHVYTVDSLDPEQRNVITGLKDASSGARFDPVDALRRDLSDPLTPIGSQGEL